jgi:hypothetical protein
LISKIGKIKKFKSIFYNAKLTPYGNQPRISITHTLITSICPLIIAYVLTGLCSTNAVKSYDDLACLIARLKLGKIRV